ncbi:MAG: hypothetical protein LBP59_14575 [Planctomycetaceae bacterium]|nr:hypothetical protein [Planctomycetaceae bacterium]
MRLLTKHLDANMKIVSVNSLKCSYLTLRLPRLPRFQTTGFYAFKSPQFNYEPYNIPMKKRRRRRNFNSIIIFLVQNYILQNAPQLTPNIK